MTNNDRIHSLANCPSEIGTDTVFRRMVTASGLFRFILSLQTTRKLCCVSKFTLHYSLAQIFRA